MSYADTPSLRRHLVSVAKVIGLIATVVVLHYLPVFQQKWIARGLIAEELARHYPDVADVGIVRVSDRSNYRGRRRMVGSLLAGREKRVRRSPKYGIVSSHW